MSELISQNKDGVVYVESDGGEVFGVVSSLKITDSDGVIFQEDSLTILENAGFNLQQDFDNEVTFIELVESNGEVSLLCFNGDTVTIEQG